MTQTARSRSAALVMLAGSALAVAGRAWSDSAPIVEIRDHRGRVAAAAPRADTAVGMADERVSLVPFFDAGYANEHPVLFTNVRYTFSNPAETVTVPVGFPELRSRVKRAETDGHSNPERGVVEGAETGACDSNQENGGDGSIDITCPATIKVFAADVAGAPVSVRVLKGDKRYRRWFVFDVTFGGRRTTVVRNRYVANLGFQANDTPDSVNTYWAGYVLHTGSAWSGAIGQGEIFIWDGGRHLVRRFAALRPTERDDVAIPVTATSLRTLGRPGMSVNYGNGSEAEQPEVTRFQKAAVVHASSRRAGKPLPHLAAMAVDGDTTTAWIDAGKQGARQEWLQVPTHTLKKLRGLRLTQGKPAPGLSRIRRAELLCYDVQGNQAEAIARAALEFELADVDETQRLLFERALGPCDAVRLTVQAIHGAGDGHVGVAEIEFLQ